MKLILVFVMFLSSCTTTDLSKSDEDKIRTDMGAFNYRVRGILYRKMLVNDLTKLTETLYGDQIKISSDSSEREYVDFWQNFKSEIFLKTSKTNFLICVKSKKLSIIFCDLANTAFVDLVSREKNDTNIKLSEVAERISFH